MKLLTLCYAALFVLAAASCDKPTARMTPTWTSLDGLTGTDITAIDFLTADYGIACGALGTLLKTEDGGANWQTLQPGTGSSLVSVFVLDRDRFYTARNGLYATDNGGATFRELGDFEATASTIFGIHFFDKQEGLLVHAGSVYKTYDGGTSWAATYPQLGFATKLAVTTNQTVYLAGGRTFDAVRSGELHKSTDDGATFQPVSLPDSIAQSEIMAISFPTDLSGYVATFDHKLYRTTDGAASWQQITAPGDSYLADLSFGDTSRGYAISGNQLYTTGNGGEAWSLELTAPDELFSLDRAEDGSLYTLGRDGILFRKD